MMPSIIDSMPDYDFSIFVLKPSPQKESNVYENAKAKIQYGCRSLVHTLVKLFLFARKNRQDIFHGFNIGPFVLLVIKLAGVQSVIYSIRGTIYWRTRIQKIARKPLWKLLSYTNTIFLANSEYSKDCFIKAVGYRKTIDVVYNPVASQRTLYKQRDVQLRNIVYVGRLVNGKNLFKWLEVARVIAEREASLKFQLYGDGYLKEKLEAFAAFSGLSGRIEFAGYEKDIIKIFHNSDLFLFLSERESFGNVVVESILCGTPVLALGIPSMKEVFVNFPEFLLLDSNGLEEQIRLKIESFSNLLERTKSAADEFSVRFSMEQYIKKVSSLYQSFHLKICD